MFAYFVVIPHENKFQSKAAAGGNGFVQGFLYDIMDIIVWEAAGVLLAAMKELLIMENEIRQNTDWLQELADDASLWEERAYEEMPAVIAHEYKRLHELAKDGNVYGTMLQLRDVFELSLKYPFLIGLCILQSSGNSEAGALYREFMSKFFSESMTLGKWFESVRKLNEQNQYLPEALAKIIKKTISLYGNNHVIGEYHGVINWRNDTIGHGALRLEADEAIRSEMRALLQMLKNYFNQYLRKIYGRCVLKQGDKVLIGYAAATEHQNNQMPFSIEIQYENGDKIPPLQDLKYVLNIDDNIGFFDSYIRNKNSSKYLDYVTGHHKLNAKDFFYELYRELRECGMVKVTQDFSREKTDDMIERMLNELEKSYHFVVPRYAYNWLDEKIKYMTKGCFMLRMGRGMGKSTLTAHLDGRYLDRDYEKYIEDDCIIRTYHCSRNQVRDFDDFIMNLNTMFLEADGMKNRITDIKKKFKMIDTEQADETERATAELLNSCKQELGKKIVLIIDGVDEIIDRKIFDFLPHSTNLDDGIYVFYTSRPEDEISDESLGERINGISIDDEWRILPDDEEFRGVLSEYAKNLLKDAKKIRKESIAEDYEHLAERAGYSFLKVQFLISLYGSGETVDATVLASEYDMFGHYLNFLRRQYMEKFFVIRMLPILVVLSIFSNGLTFREISILLDDIVDNDLMLLASLNDLKGVLSVDRSDRGNVYKLANEEYARYVKETEKDLVKEYRKSFIDVIKNAYNYLCEVEDEPQEKSRKNNYSTVLEMFPQIDVVRSKLLVLGIEEEADRDFLELLLDLDDLIGFSINSNKDLEYLSVFQWIIEKLKENKCSQSIAWLWYQMLANPYYSRLRMLSNFTHVCDEYFKQIIAERKVDDFTDFFWLAFDMLSTSKHSDLTTKHGEELFGRVRLRYEWVFFAIVCQAWRNNKFDKVLSALTVKDRENYEIIDAIHEIFEAISPLAVEAHKCRFELNGMHLRFYERIREEIDVKRAKKIDNYGYELNNLLLNLYLFLPSSFSLIKSLNETIVSRGYKPRFVYTNPSDGEKRQIKEEDAERIFNLVMDAVTKNDRVAYWRIVDSMFQNENVSLYRAWSNPVYWLAVSSNADIMFDEEMWDMVNGIHPMYRMYAQNYEKGIKILECWIKNEKKADDAPLPKELLHCSILHYFQMLYPSVPLSASCKEIVNFVLRSKEEPGESSRWLITMDCCGLVFARLFRSFHFFPKMIDDFLDRVVEYSIITVLLLISASKNFLIKKECMFYDFKNRNLKVKKMKHFFQWCYNHQMATKKEEKSFFSEWSLDVLIKFVAWCQSIQFSDNYTVDRYFIIGMSDGRIGRELFLAYLNQPNIEQVRHFKNWIDRYKDYKQSMDKEILQFYFDQYHCYFINMVKLNQDKDLFDSLAEKDRDIMDALYDSDNKTNVQRYIIYNTWMAWFSYSQSIAENAGKYARMVMSIIEKKVSSQKDDYDYSIYLDAWVACCQILLKTGELTSFDSVYEPFVSITSHLRAYGPTAYHCAAMLMAQFNWILAANLLNDFSEVSKLIPEIKKCSQDADRQWNTSRFSETSQKNIDVVNLISNYRLGKLDQGTFVSELKNIWMKLPVFPQFTTQIMGICHSFMKSSEYEKFFTIKTDYGSYYAKRYPCFFSYSDVMHFPALIQTIEEEWLEFVTEFQTQFLMPSDFMIENR
ncbi:MAG: hypothetical protein E7199_00530 [Schwartzia succinivorans]|nr:hypothetical protein [Schwartzia succinivorans]